MRLVTVQVRMFQNIIDSSEVPIEPDVTCLVGKNESGKTAFLEALKRLRPAYPEDGGFDPSESYPRWYWRRDEKMGAVESTAPVVAKFELDDQDVAALEEKYGEGTVASHEITWGITYGSKVIFKVDINEPEVVRLLAEDAPDFAAAQDAVKTENVAGFVNVLTNYEERRAREAEERAKNHADVVAAAEAEGKETPAPPDAPDEWSAAELIEEAQELVLTEGVYRAAFEVLKPRIPKFFYFSDYSMLPGRISLTEILNKDSQDLEDDERTARALLNLAGGEAEALTDEDYEHRVAELEASANEITRQVFEYWSQNQELRVSFDVDKQIESNGSGQPGIVARHLDIRLHDERHNFTTNLDTRSSGFRWFFSFIAAFSEFEEMDEPVVVLLDEPGLSLHARAQADFLRFINERLAAAHQVIYTTHSPFMVEPSALDRVRVVEDQPEVGSTVSKEAFSTDQDTLFPLQAALGYDIAQTLFVGANNLVVEGSADLVYLTTISDRLKVLGRQGLEAEWTITPAGGASNVPTFVALLGAKLPVTVLVDSDPKLNQQLTSLVVKGVLDDRRLVLVGELLGRKSADIEDLFTVEEYLDLYNAAFESSVSEEALSKGERVVRRMGADFEHGRPAEVLLRDPSRVEALSSETLERFEALFKRINATLESVAPSS